MKTHAQYTLAILLFLVLYGHTKASELDYSPEQLRLTCQWIPQMATCSILCSQQLCWKWRDCSYRDL